MKYYSAKKLNVFKVYKFKKGEKKMEEKLRDVIREEIDMVTKLLIENGSQNAIIITKWLQSLQRIDNVCKERNRY